MKHNFLKTALVLSLFSLFLVQCSSPEVFDAIGDDSATEDTLEETALNVDTIELPAEATEVEVVAVIENDPVESPDDAPLALHVPLGQPYYTGALEELQEGATIYAQGGAALQSWAEGLTYYSNNGLVVAEFNNHLYVDQNNDEPTYAVISPYSIDQNKAYTNDTNVVVAVPLNQNTQTFATDGPDYVAVGPILLQQDDVTVAANNTYDIDDNPVVVRPAVIIALRLRDNVDEDDESEDEEDAE